MEYVHGIQVDSASPIIPDDLASLHNTPKMSPRKKEHFIDTQKWRTMWNLTAVLNLAENQNLLSSFEESQTLARIRLQNSENIRINIKSFAKKRN